MTAAYMNQAIIPYLSVRTASDAIAFYKRAFEAEELERYEFDGMLGHATLRINGGTIFLADEFPQSEDTTGNAAPPSLGNRTTFTISLQVDDADAWHARAVQAGCTSIRSVSDEFFGRHGKVRDPYGHVWSLVTLKPG